MVVNKQCSGSNCNKIATFNFKNEPFASYCKDHRKENMVDVIHTKCLECDKIPCYNFENQPRGIYFLIMLDFLQMFQKQL